MSASSLLRRAALKLLSWTLREAPNPVGHPAHTDLYRAAVSGRTFDSFTHPQLSVGEHTYGIRRDSFPFYHPDDRVVIGRFCSIAEGVRFVFGEHAMDRVSTYPFRARLLGASDHEDARSKGAITLGHDVWIGTNAILLSGVTVGTGAVIGAGAVVTRDVAPYTVVGGVPARVIRARCSELQIAALLRIAWWNWPIEKIRAEAGALQGPVDAFIAGHAPADRPSLQP